MGAHKWAGMDGVLVHLRYFAAIFSLPKLRFAPRLGQWIDRGPYCYMLPKAQHPQLRVDGAIKRKKFEAK